MEIPQVHRFNRKLETYLLLKQTMISDELIENGQVPSKPSEAENTVFEAPPVQVAPSKEARYNDLIVQSYKVPEGFNLFAVFSLWILLAGFVVFPATFSSLQDSSSLSSSTPGKVVQHAIRNVPLLVSAIVCFVLGAVGICWLWRKRQREYIWLMDRLFL